MKDFSQKSQNNYYDLRASEYEQIYFREVPERRKEIEDEVERLKELTKGKSVLELACGTGYWTSRISESAKSIVASDLSEQMLNEAKKKQYHCPIQFVQADLYNLPFQPHSCDILLLGFWFSHEPKQNYDNLLKSLSHLINQNGTIWMIDNNPPAEGDVNLSTGKDEFGNNYKTRYLDDGTEFTILKNYFEKAELLAVFTGKFEIIDFIYKKYYWSAHLKPLPATARNL